MPNKIPNNLEAEIAVLSCAFLSESALDKICEDLSEDMFYSENNQKIYNVIKDLRIKGIAIDSTTVSNELDKRKQLKSVGGIDYLTEIIEAEPTAANVNHYINILFEKAILRSLIEKATNIVTECYDETKELTEVIEDAERSILSVNKNQIGKEIRPIQDVIIESQRQLENLAKNGGEITGIPSGYYDLDNRTTGFHGNELIILAGRPGMGKSAFALNVSTNIAINAKKSVAFFSLEMGAEQIVTRMFSAIGGIDSKKLRTGRLEHNDWKRLNEAMSQLADTSFYIDDTPGITVGEIRSKCRRLKNSSKGLDIIIIDYLQLVTSSSKYSGNRVQEVSEVSRDLKKLAMELNVPVIALAQLSRSVEARENKRPIMSDLKESGSIEQDADIVMFLYNDDYYNMKAKEKPNASATELIISKHRSGSTGTVDLIFEKNISSFKNCVKREEE